MIYRLHTIFFTGLMILSHFVLGQRNYRSNSVLSSGTWGKIALKESGVYKIDVPLLAGLGFNISNLVSESIRLYGNGGSMLSEKNADIPVDDLQENAILIVDGGDGIFNGTDYLLFYAAGPDQWLKDSLNKKFIHQKNLYDDSAYYFITVGGVNKKISVLQVNSPPTITSNSFNERYFHELDTVNLLSSGKDWFGEEFANAPGKLLTRNFPVLLPGLQIADQVTLVSDCIARSVNSDSRFEVRINNQPVQQITIPSTGAGIYDLFAQQVQQTLKTPVSQESLLVSYTYVPGGFNAQGWLNWFEIHARNNLVFPVSGRLLFRDWNSVGNNICEFVISNTTNTTQVWDITDPLTPVSLQGNFSSGELRVKNDARRLREYIAFNPVNALIPVSKGRIQNQNLHNVQAADYIIITNKLLQSQAERLAVFHRQKNKLRVLVITTEQVFNEFSSGNRDPSALRDFVKMYFDKYPVNSSDKLKFLLLFGDASFDYKNRISNNTNLVPAYESKSSLDPLSTYTCDDFFGFLNDNEDINSGTIINLLDIGIGRIPAKNIEEAKNFADKVEKYYSAESFGPWRTNLSFVADDEDNNLHFDDAELITGNSSLANPLFNIQKIYLDAYKQESGSGGSRYPLVNEAINNRIYNGTLLLNYIGHGGAARLAEEVILDQQMINGWNNHSRLPLFVTATCDFAPYDNPFINSIGENIILRPHTGGIGLVTTTRLVFSYSNRIMNNNFMRFAVEPDANGIYKSLGEAIMAAKNYTYQSSGDLVNNRKFTLLGDPALTLGFPKFKIRTTKINSLFVPGQTDTLSAGEKAIVEGELIENSGVLLSGFNGTIYPVVYDKPQTIFTLGNDPGSIPAGFQQQANILFKGKASVINGKFRFEFTVPKDINFQYGNGKICYYAEDGVIDGSDYFRNFVVGGSSGIATTDQEGPVIRAWLNDEKFVNGSIINQSSVLVLKLSDSSGINTSGAGIGHDITFTIDNNNNKFYVLNDYFEAYLDNYKEGKINFQLPAFEPGSHSLRIKAWDVFNNSSEIVIDFVVVNDEGLYIDHILNYPNPFTTKTQFWFEHNKPGQDLNVQIQIFSLTGRVIKTIEKTINTPGNRSSDLEWDGKDEFGDKVGRGVYLYKIRFMILGSKPQYFIEKLVVL